MYAKRRRWSHNIINGFTLKRWYVSKSWYISNYLLKSWYFSNKSEKRWYAGNLPKFKIWDNTDQNVTVHEPLPADPFNWLYFTYTLYYWFIFSSRHAASIFLVFSKHQAYHQIDLESDAHRPISRHFNSTTDPNHLRITPIACKFSPFLAGMKGLDIRHLKVRRIYLSKIL